MADNGNIDTAGTANITDNNNIDTVNTTTGLLDDKAGEVSASTDSLDIKTDNITAADTIASAITTKSGNEVTDTVYYESDFVDYDNEERVLQLFGRARVKYQNITLTADTIVYTVSNDLFQAKGAPMLIDGGDTTAGDFMAYNIKTRRGRVSYAVTRFDETYVTGSNIVKTPENCLYIEQGDYTTCQNPEHPHYYFYGRHIKVIPDDKVISRPVILNVGDAPVAVLPYFIMPLQSGRRGGWLAPTWGGSVAHGGYVDNLGYYFAPNDYFDAALSVKVQEFNSFVLNASSRYALRYMLDGGVSGRYVVDNRLENSSRQWALDYRHKQQLTPDGKTQLTGTGSILSSRSFNQLYSDNTNELEQQQLNANMSLSHRIESVNASTNVTWRRNHNLTTDRIIEDMPSFDFKLQNRAFIPFKHGGVKSEPSWYNNIYYRYDTKMNIRRDAYGNDSLPGFIRPGMEHNINLNSSQKILKYVDISPYFNMRSSLFYGAIDTLVRDTLFLRDTLVYQVKDPAADTRAPHYTLVSAIPEYFINTDGDLDTLYTVTKAGPLTRHLVRDTLDAEFNAVSSWNTGVNLSTRIYGLFPIGVMGITAVRHTMTPTVGYAFVPKHELDKTFYNVGINYDRPRPKAQQLMTLSLANSFQGKKIGAPPAAAPADSGAPTVRQREEKFDILTLSLNTSYDFEAESRHWRDLSLNANTSVGFLNVNFSSAFWLYDEADVLVMPAMRNYSFDLTAGRLGAAGKFWGGDLAEIDMVKPGDPAATANKLKTHNWDLNFSPSFSYRASRTSPQDRFLPAKSFNLSSTAGMNLTNSMSVRWNGNYDFTSNQFSHNNYTFHLDLECWEMRFTWRPEKINPGFHFVVRIKKIPDIKWEEKETKTTRVL